MNINSIQGSNPYTANTTAVNAPAPAQEQGRNPAQPLLDQETPGAPQRAFEVTITQEARDQAALAAQEEAVAAPTEPPQAAPAEELPPPPAASEEPPQAQSLQGPAPQASQIVDIVA